MSNMNTVASACFVFALTTGAPFASAAEAKEDGMQAELRKVAQQRIFFGHQSVGDNLLTGIKQLSTTAGVPINITRVSGAGEVTSPVVAHAFMERNGEPLLKLQNFEKAFEGSPSGIDIALVKFCYVDINANTDAKMLFDRYRKSLDVLKARNPGTTFIHITAPLTSEKSGAKEFLKRLLGRGNEAQNARREEYNSILRKTYLGREPIFDLARIESTAPDGKSVTVEWNGTRVPAMASAYTDDGGHLNSTGQLHAARELISVLAAIPLRKTPDQASR